MRTITIVSISLSLILSTLASSAELEQILTKDGRRLVGYYIDASSTLFLDGNPGGSMALPQEAIANRREVKREQSTDPLVSLRADALKLEAEAHALLVTARDFANFAKTNDNNDGKAAIERAAESSSQAGELEKKLATIREKIKLIIVKAKEASKAAAPINATAHKATAESGSAAREEMKKEFAEAEKIRNQALSAEIAAAIKWLASNDLTPAVVPLLGPDPRQSESENISAIFRANNKKEHLKKMARELASPDIQRQDKESIIRKLRYMDLEEIR